MNRQKPIVIGHRGAAGEAPENTLASFALAVEQGAEGIELDVHMTKDGEIVVCHDHTLDRTTNGVGPICQQTWEDIQRLDAGAWFSKAFRGERVPRLSDILDWMPAGILLNVEIKHADDEGRMEQALLALLRDSGRMEDVVISSFDHKCIRRIKQAEPEAKAGLLYTKNATDCAAHARQLGADIFSLHPHYRSIDKDDVDRAAAAGFAVYPYTVNHVEDYRRMIAFGVTGIITDFPGRLRKWLDNLTY